MEGAMNMEASAAKWYSDLEIDESFFNQWELSALDRLDAEELTLSLGHELQHSMSPESYTSCPTHQPQPPPPPPPPASTERPWKIHKTSSWTSSVSEHKARPRHDGTSPRILTFGNPDPQIDQLSLFRSYAESAKTKKEVGAMIDCSSKRDYGTTNGHGHKGANMMAPRQCPQNTEHILAERKRREKLSQSFVALSAIIPGLKKMDKASVLGDAIKYMKQLEEKVKALEEQAAKRTVESAVLIKKSQLCAEDEGTSSCDESSDGRESCKFLPEIEAKVSGRAVLFKIHCENRKGVLVKALAEIEKLHLSVVNTGVVPFVSFLDITVTARVEDEFSMTAKDLVNKLNSAFRQFT